jgi:hypothetical protein
MLRDQNNLYLNTSERVAFQRATAWLIPPGQPIAVQAYNDALEAAALAALDGDPEGFGPIDAALIRGMKVIGALDALTDDQRLRKALTEADASARGRA